MKVEKRSLSARRRLNEARARGAKRFYEGWREEAIKQDNRYYNYLNDTYHFDDGPDDSYLDKYDRVWVYGCTKNIPLVVFEGDKKYLASYEYETIGRIDTKAKEFFQITDVFSLLTFDLFEFPEDGNIPTDWDEKKTAKVASIFEDFTDDIDRLDGITVADGTLVVDALKAQLIKDVEKAYDNKAATESYPDNYDPEYDDVDLYIDLVYGGELNKEANEDMKESKEDENKRMTERNWEWSSRYAYEVDSDDIGPVRVHATDGTEYDCGYVLGCTALYRGNEDEIEGELEDYKLHVISLEDVNSDGIINIYNDDINKSFAQALLNDLVAIDGDEEMPLLKYFDKLAQESVDDFADYAADDLDYDDFIDDDSIADDEYERYKDEL